MGEAGGDWGETPVTEIPDLINARSNELRRHVCVVERRFEK